MPPALSAKHRAVVDVMEGMGLAFHSESVAHAPTMLHVGFLSLLLAARIVAGVGHATASWESQC